MTTKIILFYCLFPMSTFLFSMSFCVLIFMLVLGVPSACLIAFIIMFAFFSFGPLQKKKFVLKVELHKWLERLEKKDGKIMDRKTLTRTLNKLQKEGSCKCIKVSVPLVTNYTRSRLIDVVLHSSVGDLSPELVEQFRIRQRNFDTESRAVAAAKVKQNQHTTAITGLRISRRVNVYKPLLLEAMYANGFIGAKMIRAKLFHKFLWAYVNASPDWCNVFGCVNEGHYHKSFNQSNLLFSMEAATKEMPLELFLQVVGSAKKIDNMITWCRLGKTLSEIPTEEYNQLMDTHAKGRLSRLINILDKLKVMHLMFISNIVVNLMII